MKGTALEQAIEWTACLRSGQVQASEQQAFEAWLAATPANAQAWEQVQAHLGMTFSHLANGHHSPVRSALQAPDPARRRLLRGALVVGGLGAGALLAGRSSGLLDEYAADLRTATARRQSFNLSDGSQLLLDARSAADIDFDITERRLKLLAGKLIIEISNEARPLVVHTPHGSLQAASGQFMVALQAQSTHAWSRQGTACIRTPGSSCITLLADQGMRLDASGAGVLAANRRGESRWEDGRLSVDDWPLSDLIAALRPYRRDLLQVSDQVAPLRVSGLFSLDHSERVLASLEQTLPIRIRRLMGLWTRIEAA